MKKLYSFILVCLLSVSAFCDCYMFLGGNYAATFKQEVINAGGMNYTVMFDWGKFRGLYLEAGVDVGAENTPAIKPYDFDYSGYSAIVSGLGLRVGYPFNFDVSDTLRLSVVPALAVDFTAINGSYGKTKVIGNGERLGLVLALSATHKLGAVYLRYGVEGEACALSAMTYSYKNAYRGLSLPGGDVTAFEEWSLVPFVSLGWRL